MHTSGDPLEYPAVPLHELLNAGLSANPDSVAIVSLVDFMTWEELERQASSLAKGYLSLGLKPGDRIASLMPNRIGLVVHYLACLRAGLCLTPLNYRYTAREIDHALGVSGASALLFHIERAEDLKGSQLVSRLPIGMISYADAGQDNQFAALLQNDPPVEPFPESAPTAPAVIFFTSGSTGPAKGVTHTHESLRWMIASAAGAFDLKAGDVFLPGSSMSHVGSFLWALSTLSVNGKVVVARTFDSHEILPLLREQRPSLIAMIPAALIALIRDHDLQPGDFSSLRVCRSGSDKVSTELLTEFAKVAGFPIDEGYGMTEVGLATLNPPSGIIKQGSIGRPVPGFQIQVRNERDELVVPGEVGRIWIKTGSRMDGYWNAPEATAEVLRDGWLDSGDLAHADEDGYLWFFGRKKQVIVHDGSNISPFEVEGALDEHPAVEVAGVVGIHDEVHGETVRAYVTLREGEAKPTSAELIVFCRERIGYKAPEEIIFLDEMPLNPTGKIDRVALKKMAEDHLHPSGL
jgi:long-chain acyl-CoA synthetase